MRGEEPITQFGRMCAKLNIEVIAASSAQAKGRVERVHGTHQDRLVKKTAAEGDQQPRTQRRTCIWSGTICRNTTWRFARAAARPEDYHRRAPRAAELDRVFRLESERTISEDWVVRYDNRFFQLELQSGHYAPAQGKVLVCEGRYGNIAIEYRGRALRWQEIPAPRKPSGEVKRASPPVPPTAKRKVGAASESPVARGGSPSDGEARVQGGRRNAAVVGLALRCAPKRSALRAPQGGALADQANKQGDSVGRARWESSSRQPPCTRFFEENH